MILLNPEDNPMRKVLKVLMFYKKETFKIRKVKWHAWSQATSGCRSQDSNQVCLASGPELSATRAKILASHKEVSQKALLRGTVCT